MVGQFIHGSLPAGHGKAGAVVFHSSPEAAGIAQQISPVVVAVLLHSGQKPGHRLHERIVVHDSVPFIALEPFSRIAVMLRQDHRLRICLLHSLAKFLPELVVKALAMAQVRCHIQSPAVRVKGRGNPFSGNMQHIIHQLPGAFVIQLR